jgi:hypothetical protein
MDSFMQSDPAAQPFKDSYEIDTDTRKKKPRLEWQHPQHATLSDEEFFARRREMVMDPVIQETVKNLRKICGEKVANQYFIKYLDNLKHQEIKPGHYDIR